MLRFSLSYRAMETLLEVGRQLDRDIYPSVLDSGIVLPSNVAAPQIAWANKEKRYETQRQRRSEARAWPRTTGRQRASSGGRSPDGSGSPSQAAPILGTSLHEQYHKELKTVLQAYPNTRVWFEEDGLWLLTESELLPDLQQKAVFLIGIPYARTRIARAWGFWSWIPLRHPIWIGPRHTNFGDGSICAFEPLDKTWISGDPILELLDLYSLWALRQLHLHVVGHWPGRQVAHWHYERLLELSSSELCGCGSNEHYRNCCQAADLSRNLLSDAMDFFRIGGHSRRPPNSVIGVIHQQKDPPAIREVLPVVQIVHREKVYEFD